MPPAFFELCAFTIQSCIIAQRAGAARVELCDNPVEGGTTPSYGVIQLVREKVNIALYPIIRPRAGNYLYNDDEFQIIRRDILLCRDLGCDGISVGVGTIGAQIDTERLKRIVDWAYPMGVTCNRAFDGAPDLAKALEDVIACGCERVLTSGGKSAAPDAADVLKQLVTQADGRIAIMPGAGINSGNLAALRSGCGAEEYHASARKVMPNLLTYINTQVSDYGSVYVADEDEVKRMVALLNEPL